MIETSYLDEFNSPIRKIGGKVELLTSSTEAIHDSGTVVVAEGETAVDVNVKVTSKNLINVMPIASYNNATDFVQDEENNSFTLRGNEGNGQFLAATGQIMLPYTNGAIIAEQGIKVKGGLTYAISFDYLLLEAGKYNNYISMVVYTETLSTIPCTPYAMVQGVVGETVRGSMYIKPTEDCTIGLCFRINNNYVTISNIQVEEGTTATAYTPYIEDASGIEVYRYGKNLLDISTLPELNKNIPGIRNLIVDVENNTFSFEASIANYSIGVTMKAYLPIGTYRTSGNVTTVSGQKCGLLVRDEAGNFVVNNAGTSPNTIFTVKTPQTYSFTYYRPYSSPVGDIVTYKNVQLEVGNTTTEYEKYQEPEVITTNEDGLATGFTPLPNMTFYAKDAGALVEVECDCVFKDITTYTGEDMLKSIKVERTGEQGKFFGFGIAQKATINLLDKDREIVLDDIDDLKTYLKLNDNEYEDTFPTFYIDLNETKRDEKTNELSIVAYDSLYKTNEHTIAETGLEAPYLMIDAVGHIVEYLELNGVVYKNFEPVELYYPEGANLEGTEKQREVLNAFAEATQSIYYINSANELVFNRLGADDLEPVLIDKSQYFELTTKTIPRFGGIVHATELGDNLEYVFYEDGAIQYVRNNPFWELREDTPELLEQAVLNIAGMCIGEFECSWRGNFLLELGDFIALEAKDGSTFNSFLLNDTIEYNGGLSSKMSWAYTASEGPAATNPTTLGEALKQTYAKVDKVNKQIDLVVSETTESQESIAALAITTNNIISTVSDVEKQVNETTNQIEILNSKVEASISADDVTVLIHNELDNGVDKVTTTTGYTLNEEGLTISKSGKEITTTISEDGMEVKKGGTAVLKADHEGVKAEDLHATTFLIIGKNSRFEDYGNRTACFWIGGSN